MKYLPWVGMLLTFWGCASENEVAGGDDFPNTVGIALVQSVNDWSDDRSLRPDEQGVVEEAAVSPDLPYVSRQTSYVLGKSTSIALALTSYTIDTASGRAYIYSADTAAARITLDTVAVEWPLISNNFDDSAQVLYYARKVIKRMSGGYELQRMSPLDTYVKAPGLDSNRIRMHVERSGWRTGVLEGSGTLQESLDIDLVNFPADTMLNYPLYYKERTANDVRVLESRLYAENGDSVLVAGQNMFLRKTILKGGDSVRLAEIGVIPGDKPWHGSALYNRYRLVDYAPGNDWNRSEVEFVADTPFAEGASITNGRFRMVVQRKAGTWVAEGVFTETAFQGTLTGPDGIVENWSFAR